jgi:hypothetical protein
MAPVCPQHVITRERLSVVDRVAARPPESPTADVAVPDETSA